MSTCLSKTSSEIYQNITSYYDGNKKINEQIINRFKEVIEFYDSYAIQKIMEMNHKEICDCLDAKFSR